MQASDGTLTEDRMVKVTVTNVDEGPEISSGLSVTGSETASVPEGMTEVGDLHGSLAPGRTWQRGT